MKKKEALRRITDLEIRVHLLEMRLGATPHYFPYELYFAGTKMRGPVKSPSIVDNTFGYGYEKLAQA